MSIPTPSEIPHGMLYFHWTNIPAQVPINQNIVIAVANPFASIEESLSTKVLRK
jgi:hypothetical protein